MSDKDLSTAPPAHPTFAPAPVAAKATLHAHLSKGRDRHQPSLHLYGGLLVAQQDVQSVRAPVQNVGGAPDRAQGPKSVVNPFAMRL